MSLISAAVYAIRRSADNSGVAETLGLMLFGAAAVFGWLMTQRLGWLDGYSNVASGILAFTFAAAAFLVFSVTTRIQGARIGLVVSLIALAPTAFLAVVLIAFGGFGALEVTALLLLAVALATLAVLSFKVARGA
jgi:hypothetical protein